MNGDEFERLSEPAAILTPRGPYRMQERKGALATANVVLAFLSRFEVLQAPARPMRRFTWVEAILSAEEAEALAAAEPDSTILYVCSADWAASVLEASPSTFVLAVSRTGEIPAWAQRNRNRTVLIASKDRLVYVASLLQNLFTSMVMWESTLDGIVAAHGTLAELLDEGARALGCFMAATDAGFNDIAHTSRIEPPTNAFAQLVETGCYTPDMISHIENDILPQSHAGHVPILDPKRHDGEPDLIHYPIYYNDEYFFHLAMACTPQLELFAARDLLAVFAERFRALCSTFWDDIIMVKSPWHRVLTNLIDGVPMNDSYLATQLSLTEIPQSNKMCLLCFDLNENDTPTMRSHITEAAASLNSGQCYPFAYNGRLLVLCYSTSNLGKPFSIQEFARDIENHIPLTGKLRTGISRTFTDITDLPIAFTQALLAINFSPCIDAECRLSGRPREHYCYTFGSALPYYLLITSMRDNNLTAQSVMHGIVETLASEDRESGTEIVQLLWTYLCLERNATAASKQLHMHRNTVLYHVEKIERRFSISFDDLITRTNLLDEFRMYFLTEGFTREIEYDSFAAIRRYQERPLV